MWFWLSFCGGLVVGWLIIVALQTVRFTVTVRRDRVPDEPTKSKRCSHWWKWTG